jgi:hypothetical protein
VILYLPRHISPRYRGEAWLSKGVGDRLKTSVFNRPRKRDSSTVAAHERLHSRHGIGKVVLEAQGG